MVESSGREWDGRLGDKHQGLVMPCAVLCENLWFSGGEIDDDG